MHDLPARINSAIVGPHSVALQARACRANRGRVKRTWLSYRTIGAPVLTVLLMAILFATPLQRVWWKANPFYGDPNWGHSLFMPLAAGLYLYVFRAKILRLSPAGHWTGLFALIGGMAGFVAAAIVVKSDFTQGLLVVLTIVGLIVFLGGYQWLRETAFPMALLASAIPWSDRVYAAVAAPLQQLAAVCAVNVLRWTGAAVMRSGTNISLYRPDGSFRVLQVAEACSGLRSLMTFVALAAIVAFLSPRRLWVKLTIVAAAVPVAVAGNVLRVVGAGLLDHYVSERASEGFYHVFFGMTILVAGMVVIVLLACVLDGLVSAAPAPPALVPPTPAPVVPPHGGRDTLLRRWSMAMGLLGAGCATILIVPPLLHVHLVKTGLPAPHAMSELPTTLGRWHQIGVDGVLEPEMTAALGADDYLFREFAIASPPDASSPLPLHLAVTYYGQPLSGVPHLAERCYLAAGYVVEHTKLLTLPIATGVTARLTDFRDVTGVFASGRSVMYFFVVDGRLVQDRLEIANILRDPHAKYSFLCKVEVMTEQAASPAAVAQMSDFLEQLVPQVRRLLPDWTAAERNDT